MKLSPPLTARCDRCAPAVFCAVRESLIACLMDSGGTISVILRNNNSTLATNEFEVFDNTCGRSVGTFTLKGGESRAIEISADDSGKGSVKIRNPDLGPNDWVQVDAISAGDVVTA
jgi:hypothetical protein